MRYAAHQYWTACTAGSCSSQTELLPKFCAGWQSVALTARIFVVEPVHYVATAACLIYALHQSKCCVLSAVLATATATAAAFYKVDALAGKLFLPYLAWLAFANALNAAVYKLNPHVRP